MKRMPQAPPIRPPALWWLVLMVLLAGLNLRPLLTTLGTNLELIRVDLGLSSTLIGALAAIPTLCMGLVSLAGGWVITRLGVGAGMRLALLLIAVGCVLRWAGDWLPMLALATALAGLGIACGQVLIPVVIKRYFPSRAALMMGGYTTAMNLGAALGALAAPLAISTLGSWQASLAIWALPALLAALLWPGRLRVFTEDGPAGVPWRSALGWRMALFLGTGSLAYMTLLAWLVPLYMALGLTQEQGGAMLVAYTAAQIAGAFLVPPMAQLQPDRRPALALTLALLSLGLAGLCWAPTWGGASWVVLAGFGLGGSFPLALTLPLDYAHTPTEAGRLSAMVLGFGMLMGSFGPLLFGVLRDGFGFYAALIFLLLATVASFLLGLTFRPPNRNRSGTGPLTVDVKEISP